MSVRGWYCMSVSTICTGLTGPDVPRPFSKIKPVFIYLSCSTFATCGRGWSSLTLPCNLTVLWKGKRCCAVNGGEVANFIVDAWTYRVLRRSHVIPVFWHEICLYWQLAWDRCLSFGDTVSIFDTLMLYLSPRILVCPDHPGCCMWGLGHGVALLNLAFTSG